MGYPQNNASSSYVNGQTGNNNPLYSNNYNPNQYTYGASYAGMGGVNYGNNQAQIQGNNQQQSNTPYYQNQYQNQGQAGYQPGQQTSSYQNTGAFAQPQGDVEMSRGQVTAGKVAAGLGAGFQVAGTVADISQDLRATSKFDVNQSLPGQVYNPRSAPPVYTEQATPEEISKGTGGRAALKYAGKGAATGAAVGSLFGPVGTLVGGAAGAIGGAIAGVFKGKKAKKKRAEFEKRQEQQREQYTTALTRYYDIQNQSRQQTARSQSLGQRGQNLAPLYNSSIYGISNY